MPELCERVRTLLVESDARVVLCDAGTCITPDAVTIDALARLQLTARRLGREVRLCGASTELHDLLRFMGLSEVVPDAKLLLEPERQAEEREHRVRVEEESELGDAAV